MNVETAGSVQINVETAGCSVQINVETAGCSGQINVETAGCVQIVMVM